MNRHSKIHRNRGNSTLIFVAVIIIAVALGLYFKQKESSKSHVNTYQNLIMLPKPKELGDVTFLANDGSKFNATNLTGQWTILFFAFTHCPDICPSTLHTLGKVKKELENQELWDAFQLAMVTVDPERDSIDRLNQYVPFYDPSFIGLRGELTYTEKFAKNLGILFFKGEVQDNGGYDVDHGASLILIDPNGKYAGVIPAPHKQETLAADLAKVAKTAIEQGQIKPKAKTNKTNRNRMPLSVTDSWIRIAPPNAMALAGYATFRNESQQDIIITGVKSPLFKKSLIHTTNIENGIASMNHLDQLQIQPDSQAVLAPMGTHLMLMHPAKPLNLGDIVPITIMLKDGSEAKADFVVKAPPERS